jgi:hypothetical protein
LASTRLDNPTKEDPVTKRKTSTPFQYLIEKGICIYVIEHGFSCIAHLGIAADSRDIEWALS